MIDAAGQEVKVGDLVIFAAPYNHELVEGIVLRLTPKGMTMEYSDKPGQKINRRLSQVIKLPNELRLQRLLGI